MTRKVVARRFSLEAACVHCLLWAAAGATAGQQAPEQGLLEHARALREAGEAEKALEVLLPGIDAFPASPALHHLAGQALEDLERFEGAAGHFEAALGLRADYVPALLSLGASRSEAGRLDEAARLLETAVALESGSAAANHNLAMVLWRQGKLPAALAAARRAVHIAPRDARAAYGLGCVLESQGQLEEARTAFTTATGLDPGLAPAWYRLATIAFRLGQKGDGEASLRRFRAAKAREHVERADRHWKRGDRLRAGRELERALDADETCAEAHARLGSFHLQGGDTARAVTHARRAAALNPGAARFANLAWALHQAGDREEALEWIDRALELEPGREELQAEKRAILAPPAAGQK